MASLLLDTGFFIALGNKNDRFHQEAIVAAENYHHYSWFTTWSVITELGYLLPAQAVSQLLSDQLRGLFAIKPLTELHIPRLLQILKKYPNLDIADASLVILAEELKTGDIFSVDQRDFLRLRWGPTHKKFHNLLL